MLTVKSQTLKQLHLKKKKNLCLFVLEWVEVSSEVCHLQLLSCFSDVIIPGLFPCFSVKS